MHDSRCSHCGAPSASSSVESVAPGVTTFAAAVPGTRHHVLLNSNQPPEDSEIGFIRSAISETDAPLSRLDEEISRLRKALKALEEEHASLSNYRTQNAMILSPLRRMPSELLCEIFSWTIPLITDALDMGRLDMGVSPWVLTRISSHWRRVSVTTPSLWSLVHVDYSAKPKTFYSLSLVEAQIQRSQKLKIHFYGSVAMDAGPQIAMLELLAQHSARWEELSLGITAKLIPFLPTLRGRLPSLRRIWIQWNETEFPVDSIDCFHTAPSLVDVGIYNRTRFIPIGLPAHQLTRYELDCSWPQHMAILKLAPRLVEARIDIDFDDEPWPERNANIYLPSLRRLHVSDAEVFDYFKVPALEELSVWVGTDTSDLTHLASLLDRSECALRYLCLTGVPDAHRTTQMLGRLSHLTELAIIVTQSESIPPVNALILALTLDGRSTVVAPQLRSLLFGCGEVENYLDFPLFLWLLKSRWNAEGCALQTAVLGSKVDGPDTATLQGLYAMRSLGFDFLAIEGEDALAQVKLWTFQTSWN
ncbi:hypothetical protein DFH06DRAFT_1047337 [Mycena polygramma]|nr:hypothetical protein DFH06DRAFT_1047337 [Mycena polygramma]